MKTIKFLSKVGTNKGRSRIWLEGARLAQAGFKWHVKYETYFDVDNVSIELVVDTNGSRKVAGRTRNNKDIPIIDLCSSDITKFANGSDFVEVRMINCVILITRSNKKLGEK